MTARVIACLCIVWSLTTGCALVPIPPVSDVPSGRAVAAPHGVYFPITPERTMPNGRDGSSVARERMGPVTLEKGRAASLWISSLEIVRVTATSPEAAQALRFSQVVAGNDGAGAARLWHEGIVADPVTRYLVGPPGAASSWIIESDETSRVVVERIAQPGDRLIWEVVEQQLRDWARDGGPLPLLPSHPEAKAAAFRLAAWAELRAMLAVRTDDSALHAALSDWLTAEALRQVERMRPRLAPYYDRRSLDPQLRSLGARRALATSQSLGSRSFYRLSQAETSTVELRTGGHGEIELFVRPVFAADGEHAQRRALVVRSGTRVLHREALISEPAFMTAADAALPTEGGLRTDGGEFVGALHAVRIKLGPDDRHLTLEVSGGPIVLRGSHNRRRPWARLSDEQLASTYVIRARASLAARDGPLANAISSLLDHAATDGPLVESDRMPHALHLALRWLAGSDGRFVDVLTYLVNTRGGSPLGTWAAAERLRPAVPLRPELADYLDALDLPVPTAAQPSAIVGLRELAWRRDPSSAKLRRGYMNAWYRGSHWSMIEPVVVAGAQRLSAPRLRWVRPPQPDALPVSDPTRRGYRWPIAPGQPYPIDVAPPLAGDDRTHVVQFIAISDSPDLAFVTVDIDGQPWSFATPPGAERVSFTMDPGPHVVRMSAPPDVFLFAPTRSAQLAAEARPAEIRGLVAISQGDASTRFRRPPTRVPGPVRVRLRVLLPSGREEFDPQRTVRLTVGSDVGFQQHVELRGLRVDRTMVPLDDAPRTSQAFDAIVWPPSSAWELWVEAESSGDKDAVVASMAVRRTLDSDPEQATETTASLIAAPRTEAVPRSQDAMRPIIVLETRIQKLSRRLQIDALDHRARLDRAQALLDLGDLKHAWADAEFVVAHRAELAPTTQRRLDALLLEFEIAREPSSLPTGVQILAGRVEPASPFLIAGSAPRGPDGAPLKPRSMAGDGSLDPLASPHAMAVQARLAQQRGAYRRAAELYDALYERLSHWRFVLGRATSHELALANDSSAILAPYVYGTMRKDRDAGLMHPLVSRVYFNALRASQWERGNKPDHAAGYEWLVRRPTAAPPGTPLSLRAAMVGAPWPQWEGHTLRKGQTSEVAANFRRPHRVRVQVVCQRLHDEAKGDDCPLTLTVDDVHRSHHSVRSGEQLVVPVGEFLPGEHTFEMKLDTAEAGVIAATRFSAAVDEDSHYSHLRGVFRGRRLVATLGAPVAMTLSGPTTVEVSVRGLGSVPPERATVVATHEHGTVETVEIPLLTSRDDAASIERSAHTAVADKTVAYLALAQPGEHVVRVSLPRGEALVRLRRRRARETAAPPPTRRALTSVTAEDDGVPWPAGTPVIEPLDLRPTLAPRGRLGTVSAVAIAAVDGIEDRDVLNEDYRQVRGEVELAWQRGFSENLLRLDVGPRVGIRRGTGVVGGGNAIALMTARWGLRASLEGRITAQSFIGAPEWGALARLRVGQRLRLAHRWTLTPAVMFTHRELSLTADEFRRQPAAADPRVFNTYHDQHPQALQPDVTLRWTPTMTQAISLRPSATLNADFRSLDRLDLRLTWRGIYPTHRGGDFIAGLQWGPSVRLADTHRGSGYLRSDIRAELYWSIWTGPNVRALLGVRDTIVVYDTLEVRNTFRLMARFDISRGRRLADLQPRNALFPEITGRRYWQERSDERTR